MNISFSFTRAGRVLPLAALALALTTGAHECEHDGPPPGSCEVGGVIYEDGMGGVPSPDGCNTCVCSAGALTSCTEAECPPPGGACVVGGVTYPDGARGIPAPDGCNSCACSAGALACTEIACTPPDGSCVVRGITYPDGATGVPAPDGCNTCSCESGVVTGCTELACAGPACSVYGRSYADGWAPAPDGCNTCACEDGQVSVACTEIACATPVIEACTAWSAPFTSDAFDLNGVAVAGDNLEVSVAYSGGCANHYFRLCYEPAFLESNPVQVELRLEHDGQGDPCEAYPSETRAFDLRPLAAAYNAAYGASGGTVHLRLGEGASYTF